MSVFVVFLLLVFIFKRLHPVRGFLGLAVSVVLAAVVFAIPWFGQRLPFWIMCLAPNASIPVAGLLLAGLFGRRVFRECDWNAAWTFGAAAAITLYPSALGLGSFDTYSLGWPWLFWGKSGILFGAVAVCSAWLLWRGNRFGYLLLLANLGFTAGFQESTNLWDCILDPLFAAVSLVACLIAAVRGWTRRAGPSGTTAR
jgi:hypothetical protein